MWSWAAHGQEPAGCLPGAEGVGGEVEGGPEVVEEQVQLEVRLDRGNAHALGCDLLLASLFSSARLKGSHWTSGLLSLSPLALDLRDHFAEASIACQGTIEFSKNNNNSQRYISRLVFCFSLKYYETKKYFTMQTSTMSCNYHCDSFSICFAVIIEKEMPRKINPIREFV